MGWSRPSHFLVGIQSEAMSRVHPYLLLLAVVLFASCFPASQLFAEHLARGQLRHAMELQQAGDLEGAVRGYRQFLALRPNEAAVQANLGVLLAHLGLFDEAIAAYRKAASLDPKNADIILNLGLAYYKSGRLTEATPIPKPER